MDRPPMVKSLVRCALSGRFSTFTLACVLSVLLPGCFSPDVDEPREMVRGRVTIDGEPLARGVIEFDPTSAHWSKEEGLPAGAAVIEGSFYINRSRGPVPGKYKVSVKSEESHAVRPAEADHACQVVPPKFNTATQLLVEIEPDSENVFDISLTSK